MSNFPSIPMTTEETIEFNKWLEEHDKQIKADAIEEFIEKFIKRTHLRQMTKAECIKVMYDIADELKEQKNG